MSNNKSIRQIIDRRGGRKRWYHAPTERGDVMSSEVKSKEQELANYSTAIK
jgi:hypothetical protein